MEKMYDPDKPKTIEKNIAGLNIYQVILIVLVLCCCSSSFSNTYRDIWFNDDHGLIFYPFNKFNELKNK